MDWTDETIARLRELWGQGLSTADIGRQLGITKNAVVGKAHRLGLPPRPSPIRNRDGESAVEAGQAPEEAQAVTGPDPVPPPQNEAKAGEAKTGEAAAPPVVAAPPVDEAPAPETPVTGAPAAEAPPAEPVKKAPAPRAEAPPEPKGDAKPSPVAPPVAAPSTRTSARSAAPSRATARSGAGLDRPARRGPTCCWPIGDPGTPEFRFCGAPALSGKPYCAEHAAIAYVKIRDRRD